MARKLPWMGAGCGEVVWGTAIVILFLVKASGEHGEKNTGSKILSLSKGNECEVMQSHTKEEEEKKNKTYYVLNSTNPSWAFCFCSLSIRKFE